MLERIFFEKSFTINVRGSQVMINAQIRQINLKKILGVVIYFTTDKQN